MPYTFRKIKSVGILSNSDQSKPKPTKFESQKISGGCPATNNSDCVTQVDWVCNHTNPDRCEGGDARRLFVGF